MTHSDGDNNIVHIGCFRIDLEQIAVKDLIKLRKKVPKEEYRLLKNRKCARESRKKKREAQIKTNMSL